MELFYRQHPADSYFLCFPTENTGWRTGRHDGTTMKGTPSSLFVFLFEENWGSKLWHTGRHDEPLKWMKTQNRNKREKPIDSMLTHPESARERLARRCGKRLTPNRDGVCSSPAVAPPSRPNHSHPLQASTPNVPSRRHETRHEGQGHTMGS
jgi:hypothetical protein